MSDAPQQSVDLTDETNDSATGLDGETDATIEADLAPAPQGADRDPREERTKGPAAGIAHDDRSFDERVEAIGVLDGFDQTNGRAAGLEGDADGRASGDLESAAEQEHKIEPRPVGAQDTWHSDWYGDKDGTDPNP